MPQLTGNARIRTKAASEMLIRRRLGTLKTLVSEYNLTVSVELVTSSSNLSDPVTWVLHKWLVAVKLGAKRTTGSKWYVAKGWMDDIHYGGRHVLILIDCGHTRYAIWWSFAQKDPVSVHRQLSFVFYKRGTPEEILTNNDTAFCNQQVSQCLHELRSDGGCNARMYH